VYFSLSLRILSLNQCHFPTSSISCTPYANKNLSTSKKREEEEEQEDGRKDVKRRREVS
jgi:hypothetical protein